MARKRAKHSDKDENRPVEINMTDLEKGGQLPDHAPYGDIHAAGTPGGGTAAGGLAGTNVGAGSPEGVDLEDALGSGIYDNDDAEDGEESAS